MIFTGFSKSDKDPRVVGHHIAWKRRVAEFIFLGLFYIGCAITGVVMAYRVAVFLGWR